jgi:hypothetical protein
MGLALRKNNKYVVRVLYVNTCKKTHTCISIQKYTAMEVVHTSVIRETYAYFAMLSLNTALTPTRM